MNPRYRATVWAVGLLIAVWGLALGGYSIARSSKMTAEKVRTYLTTVDLSRLSAEERARALRELADRLNALPLDERRKARLEHAWGSWFQQMTDTEKAEFIDATMPTGFKQMIASFEQLPEAKRRQTVDDALKRMQRARSEMPEDAAGQGPPPEVNEELRQKIVTIGLRTYYSQSSAQTKAELAPVLEEIQRVMESGRTFRPRHGPHE